MKSMAKIFTIIGMVLGFWMIVPLVVGILSLKKLEAAETKEDLKVMGIVNLLFCSLIGGICMLMIKEEELKA